jgi:short-subunit dehydrogenase
VLVVGGSTGIGLAIARGFVQASASRVILTGRRKNVLDRAISQLQKEAAASGTIISSFVSDHSDLRDSETLWAQFKKDGYFIDVLVLSAAILGEEKPLLQTSLDSAWSAFETNVRGRLDYAQRFDSQGGEKPKAGVLAQLFSA